MIADYCSSWPSHIVANTDKDFIESRAYSICDIHYSFKGSELFIISNVQALNIPYSFTVLTRYSLFIIPLPPPKEKRPVNILVWADIDTRYNTIQYNTIQ